MKGFLAYHALHGRQKFIDELHVDKEWRRNNVAKSLLHAVLKGPLELHVRSMNTEAIMLYTTVGMCSSSQGIYEPNKTHICMRTTNYKQTKEILSRLPLFEVDIHDWKSMTMSMRRKMVNLVKSNYGKSAHYAKRLLRVNDTTMRYAVVC